MPEVLQMTLRTFSTKIWGCWVKQHQQILGLSLLPTGDLVAYQLFASHWTFIWPPKVCLRLHAALVFLFHVQKMFINVVFACRLLLPVWSFKASLALFFWRAWPASTLKATTLTCVCCIVSNAAICLAIDKTTFWQIYRCTRVRCYWCRRNPPNYGYASRFVRKKCTFYIQISVPVSFPPICMTNWTLYIFTGCTMLPQNWVFQSILVLFRISVVLFYLVQRKGKKEITES